MGQDKATLRWGGTSLLDHMVQLLSTVASPVRVVGRSDFPDGIPGKGPLGGILTALETTDQEANLLIAVDLPLLTPDFLRMFQARCLASTKALVACRISGDFPLCLGIQKRLAKRVAERVQADRLAVHPFIEESDAETLEEDELRALGFGPSMFSNVNTPDDLRRIR